MATILFDDINQHVNLIGSWAAFASVRLLGGSGILPNTSDLLGSFSVTFNGTSVSLFGALYPGPLDSDQIGIITIDGGTPFNTSNFPPKTNNASEISPYDVVERWFQSPILPDTTHTITVSNISVALDYVLVTAGNDTPLSGETLLADDGDPAIVYDGTWTRNSTKNIVPKTGDQDAFIFVPLGNATHHTNVTGSSATFNFTGTSISVYGILNKHANFGRIFIRYTMDGFSFDKMYTAATTATQVHFPWYSNDTLAAGDHTLKMEVTDTEDVAFVLDYITFKASFHSLATKGSSIGASSNRGISKPTLIGVIIGGVVGFLIILALILFIKQQLFRRATLSRSSSSQLKVGMSSATANLVVQQNPDSASPPPAMPIWDRGLQPNRVTGIRPFTLQTRGADFASSDDDFHVQRKPPLPGAISPETSELAHQANNPFASESTGASARIQMLEELVVELQQELAQSGGRTNEEDDGDNRTSDVTSALPPPYEPDSGRRMDTAGQTKI